MEELTELLEEFIKEKTEKFYKDFRDERGAYTLDGIIAELDEFLAQEASLSNFYIFLKTKDNNLDKTDNPLP